MNDISSSVTRQPHALPKQWAEEMALASCSNSSQPNTASTDPGLSGLAGATDSATGGMETPENQFSLKPINPTHHQLVPMDSSSNEHTPPMMMNRLGGPHFDRQLDGFLDRFQEEIFQARSLKDDLDRLSGDESSDYVNKKNEFKNKMEQIRSLFATEGEDFVNSLEKRNPQLSMAACGANTIELAQGIDRLETAVREEETKRQTHQPPNGNHDNHYPGAAMGQMERSEQQYRQQHSQNNPLHTNSVANNDLSSIHDRTTAPPIAPFMGSPPQVHGPPGAMSPPMGVGMSNMLPASVPHTTSPLSPRTTGLLTAHGLVVGHTLNNLSSDETLQLMQSDIQSLKLQLMRLQRTKVTNGTYAANNTPHSLPNRSIDSGSQDNSPASGSYSTAVSPPSMAGNNTSQVVVAQDPPSNTEDANTDGNDPGKDRDRDREQLPASILANNNVNVVRVTGRATGSYQPPTYVSHLEQMKSRIEALEKKPLSRRAKSVARLGRTHTMGSMYEPHSGPHGLHTHSIRPLHHHHHLHRQSQGSESSPHSQHSGSSSATSPNHHFPYRRTQRASSQLTIHHHHHHNHHAHIPHHQSLYHIPQTSLLQSSHSPSSSDIVHHVPSPPSGQSPPLVHQPSDENQNPNMTAMKTPPNNLRHSKRRSISTSSPLAPISSNVAHNYQNTNGHPHAVIYSHNSVRRSPPLRSSPVRPLASMASRMSPPVTASGGASPQDNGGETGGNLSSNNNNTHRFTIATSSPASTPSPKRPSFISHHQSQAISRSSTNSSSSPSQLSPNGPTVISGHSPDAGNDNSGHGGTQQEVSHRRSIHNTNNSNSSGGGSPAKLFFDAPEEMLNRPQSHAAARDIQRYSLKVARRFIPVGGNNNGHNLGDRMLSDAGALTPSGFGNGTNGGVGNGNESGVEPRSKSAVTTTGASGGIGLDQPLMGHTFSDVGTTGNAGTGGSGVGGTTVGNDNKTAAMAVTTMDSSVSGGAVTTSSNGRVVEEIQGELWVRKGVVWKRWRRRYASIISHQYFGRVMCLISYDSNGALMTTKSQIVVLQGSLCKTVRDTVEIGGQLKHIFILRTASKEYHFAVESEEEKRSWIKEVRDSSKVENSRMTQTSTAGVGHGIGKGGRSMAFRRRQ